MEAGSIPRKKKAIQKNLTKEELYQQFYQDRIELEDDEETQNNIDNNNTSTENDGDTVSPKNIKIAKNVILSRLK